MAGVLRGLDADVIALQEVDRGRERSGGVDQARALGEALGMSWRFAPALLFDAPAAAGWRPLDGEGRDPAGSAYGIALLTRAEPERAERLALPAAGLFARGRRREPRVALLARVRAGGKPVTVAATHLTNVRLWNVVQLRFLQYRLLGWQPPRLVLGDLNLRPWTLPLASRRGWLRVRCGATFPSQRPDRQLDHVLGGRGQVRLLGAEVVTTAISDHCPVVAEVELDAGEPAF